MSFKETVTLNTGAIVPQIGLGTWMSKPKEVEHAVEHAIRHGYKHLDLAMIYQNQHEVGAALAKVIPSVVKREELFITSKLWNSSHRASEVEKELDETLKQLGTPYVDLYLIHWPCAFVPGRGLVPEHPTIKGEVELDIDTTLVETWKAMIKLPATGKVKSVGVSNFRIHQIEALIEATGVVPAVNQIEAHPLLPQDELVAYCKEKNIHITAYSPLGNNLVNRPKLTEEPVIKEIAERLKATPAQVLVAWGVYRGYSVIPKSVQNERIESNFVQVKLSEEDYNKITALGAGAGRTRFNIPYGYTPKWDINLFDEPEELVANYKQRLV